MNILKALFSKSTPKTEAVDIQDEQTVHKVIDASIFGDDEKRVLRVVQVEPESDCLSEALGLTDERCQELWTALRKIAFDSDSKSEIYEKISKECNHANELVMALRMSFKMEQENSMDPIAEILKSLRGGSDD